MALTTSEQLPPKTAILLGGKWSSWQGGSGLGFWVLLVTSRSYQLLQDLLLFTREVLSLLLCVSPRDEAAQQWFMKQCTHSADQCMWGLRFLWDLAGWRDYLAIFFRARLYLPTEALVPACELEGKYARYRGTDTVCCLTVWSPPAVTCLLALSGWCHLLG